MNPKNLSVRMDRETGELWLTEEKYRQKVRRVANITAPVLLALCADLVAEDGTKEVTRDVKFNDFAVRISAKTISLEEYQDGGEPVPVDATAQA